MIALRLLAVAGLDPDEDVHAAGVPGAVRVRAFGERRGPAPAWLRGPVGVAARVLAGVGSILLLYLEPPWIAVGLGALAMALVVHLVLSRGGSRPDDGS